MYGPVYDISILLLRQGRFSAEILTVLLTAIWLISIYSLTNQPTIAPTMSTHWRKKDHDADSTQFLVDAMGVESCWKGWRGLHAMRDTNGGAFPADSVVFRGVQAVFLICGETSGVIWGGGDRGSGCNCDWESEKRELRRIDSRPCHGEVGQDRTWRGNPSCLSGVEYKHPDRLLSNLPTRLHLPLNPTTPPPRNPTPPSTTAPQARPGHRTHDRRAHTEPAASPPAARWRTSPQRPPSASPRPPSHPCHDRWRKAESSSRSRASPSDTPPCRSPASPGIGRTGPSRARGRRGGVAWRPRRFRRVSWMRDDRRRRRGEAWAARGGVFQSGWWTRGISCRAYRSQRW